MGSTANEKRLVEAAWYAAAIEKDKRKFVEAIAALVNGAFIEQSAEFTEKFVEKFVDVAMDQKGLLIRGLEEDLDQMNEDGRFDPPLTDSQIVTLVAEFGTEDEP